MERAGGNKEEPERVLCQFLALKAEKQVTSKEKGYRSEKRKLGTARDRYRTQLKKQKEISTYSRVRGGSGEVSDLLPWEGILTF